MYSFGRRSRRDRPSFSSCRKTLWHIVPMHTEPMRWLAVYQRRLVVRTGKPCWKYTQPGETLRSKDNDVRWLDRIIVPRQTETEVTSYTSCCDIQRQRRVYQRAV